MLAQPLGIVFGTVLLTLVCWASLAHAQPETAAMPGGTSIARSAPPEPSPARSAQSETPARRSPLRLLLATEVALHSADMASTVYALRQPGLREANPLLSPLARRPAALVAVSGAVNVLQVYAISKLQRRHAKLAASWAVMLIGLESYAVIHNLRVVRASRAIP